MRERGSKAAWWMLALYLLCGIGVGAGPFRALAAQWFGRAGFGTFFIVNVMLPTLAVVLGAIHGRVRVAAAGGVLLALGIVIEAMLRLQPNLASWNLQTLAAASHPILVVAAIGYSLLGAAAAWGSSEVQRWAKGSPAKSF